MFMLWYYNMCEITGKSLVQARLSLHLYTKIEKIDSSGVIFNSILSLSIILKVASILWAIGCSVIDGDWCTPSSATSICTHANVSQGYCFTAFIFGNKDIGSWSWHSYRGTSQDNMVHLAFARLTLIKEIYRNTSLLKWILISERKNKDYVYERC